MGKKEKIRVDGTRQNLHSAFSKLDNLQMKLAPDAPEKTPPPENEKLSEVKSRGRVVLRKEKAQRGGKTVIVIDDIPSHIPLVELENIARDIRKQCGCGGTLRNRTIEVQGDQPARIRSILEGKGFKVAGIQ